MTFSLVLAGEIITSLGEHPSLGIGHLLSTRGSKPSSLRHVLRSPASREDAARRYLPFASGTWILATVPFIGYAFGTTVWQLMAFAVVFGAGETAGMVVWGTLMSSRVPPELRGRVHSLDWFVSIGLTPLSFALTGPVSKAIGTDATLVLAGVLPMVVCAVLFAFTLSWNEFIYALTFTSSSEEITASVGVTSELIRGDIYFWGSLMAGAVLGSIPIVALYVFFLDYYVSGLTAGAVK